MTDPGFEHVDLLVVKAWGRHVGTLGGMKRGHVFEYAPSWAARRVELAPLVTPNRPLTSTWPEPGQRGAFHGLPPFIADSLPDSYGDAVMGAYLSRRGMTREALTPLDRLAYIGDRGMGALTFEPAISFSTDANSMELAQLVGLSKSLLRGHVETGPAADMLPILVQVSGSAGGAQAKALVSYRTAAVGGTELFIGTGVAPSGFRPAILKLTERFDGAISQPGRVEAAYARMASAAGVDVPESLLIEEEPEGDSASHFLVHRFDRGNQGNRFHMQTLAAMTGRDFNDPRGHDYGVYLNAVKSLGLPGSDLEQAYRRIVFNVAAAVRDDHLKNFGFLCDQEGTWCLSPAYDLTFTAKTGMAHQTYVLGKAAGITESDLVELAQIHDVSDPELIIEQVKASVQMWTRFAALDRVPDADRAQIAAAIPRWVTAATTS